MKKNFCLIIALVLVSSSAFAQCPPSAPQLIGRGTQEAALAETSQNQAATITVPAGTRLLMQLVSPLNTESAVEGSGVYLETAFPLVCDNRVVIPARTHVQGVIEADQRAKRFKRRARFGMRFTSLVFLNGYTVPIDGVLQSLPGSQSVRLEKSRKQVARVDQLDKALPKVATGALTGGVIGSVSRTGLGTWRGAGWGAALALGAVLITRGDSIHLPQGTKVEMMLQAPVIVPHQPAADPVKAPSPVQDATAGPAPSEENSAALNATARRQNFKQEALNQLLMGGLLRSILY